MPIRAALILAGAVILAAAIAVLLLRNPEPRYQGRSLSSWYRAWANAADGSDAYSKSEAQRAEHAIREIGTNALPLLLKRLEERKPPPKALVYLINSLPPAIRDSRAASRLLLDDGKVEPTTTFRILGPIAAPAVPRLTTFLFATNKRDLSYSAAFSLAAIGPEGLPPLITALTNPALPCAYYSARWLSCEQFFTFGTNIAQAVPLLARCTTASDFQLQHAAVSALGAIRADPETAIPALNNCISSNATLLVRAQAMRSLARYGSRAIPVLLACLNDPDRGVRGTATNCLQILAPVLLTNSPPQ